MRELWTPDRKLHLPSPDILGTYIEVGAWDKAGHIYYQKRERSRSPVKQLLQLILCQMKQSDQTGVKDYLGASYTIDFDATGSHFGCLGGANDDTKGILIGTGSTAVDILDYTIETLIADGSGAGEMLYQLQVYDSDVTVSDPDCTFETYRNYNNNSGDTVTVKETAIQAIVPTTVTNKYFLLIRDVPTQVAIPDGGGCYVKYTLQITE